MIILHEHLVEKLAKIRLVLIDIDGTLVSSSRDSFDNVLTQLRKMKPLNIGFSIATGRTICGAAFVTSQLQELGRRLPPMITYNGAVVLSGSDSKILVRRLIEKQAFAAVIQRCRAVGIAPLAYACGHVFDFVPREVVYSEGAERPEPEFNGMSVQVVPDLLELDDDFVAILVEVPDASVRAALTSELSEQFGAMLRVTTSGGRYIEICHPLGTKLRAMAELARVRSIEVDEIMAIGDNFNDKEMIAGAGVGVAVANAPLEVRAVATMSTTLPSGQGVVETLRALTRAVRSQPRPKSRVG